MNAELLNYIRSLSLKDTKTLSQKALKTTEEVGELAKAILPFDGAHGTNHRFVNKENIIEECVDVILCALSIAYSLGSTDSSLEDFLFRKAGKWAILQDNESKYQKNSKFSLPFELHVTVKIEAIDEAMNEVDRFISVCKENGYKPIILHLTNVKNGTDFLDVMTETKMYGSNRDAFEALTEISSVLKSNGFEVVREKIETVPWHPAAPKKDITEMPKNGYFEAHFAYDIPTEDYRYLIPNLNKAEFSIAVNKSKSDEKTTRILITVREWIGSYDHFIIRIETAKEILRKFINIDSQSEVHEFSIYDTNVSHDLAWLEK